MPTPPESPPEAETEPAESEYQQSPEDEQLWRAHVDYVRRTAADLLAHAAAAQRLLAQAGKARQDLDKADCGADCCIGSSDRIDADRELAVADRALRHVERIAAGLLAQVEKVAES